MITDSIVSPKAENPDISLEDLRKLPGCESMPEDELKEIQASVKELCLLTFNVQPASSSGNKNVHEQ